MQPSQTLLEKEEPQQDADKGGNEIPQAGLKHLPMLHGDDEDQPVGGDEECRGDEDEQRFPVCHDDADIAPAPAQGDEQAEEEHRPDDPVGDHLQRRHRGDRLEIDGEETPDQIGDDAETEAGSSFGVLFFPFGQVTHPGQRRPPCRW